MAPTLRNWFTKSLGCRRVKPDHAHTWRMSMWYTSVGFPLFEKQKPCERLERKTCLLTQELRKVHTNNYDNQNNVKSRKTFQMSERKEHTFHPIHQETARNNTLVRGRTKTHNSNPIHQEKAHMQATGGNVGTIQGKNIANAIECPSRHKTGPLYPQF